MFETIATDAHTVLREVVAAVVGLPDAADEAEAIDRIGVLEAVKAACAAAQAEETVRLERLRTEAETARGIPAHRRGRGLAAEIALARRVSAHTGGRHLGFARAMTEMPHTRTALRSGVLSEWRATLLVRETACLGVDDRAAVDVAVCGDPGALAGMGDRELESAAKRAAYERDPHAVVARNATAPADRRVSVRPAPDCMIRLSALLPMTQGISAYAALKRHADATYGHDDRSRTQIMADTLVERTTGAASASAMPIAVNLLMPESVLTERSDSAVQVDRYGPVPATTARSLLADALDSDALVELRRLFQRPSDGSLVSMESRARAFPPALRRFLDARDQHCRMPYCDGLIAEYDHAHDHSDGGPTCATNGLGMCLSHNRAKQNAGWRVIASDDDVGRHTAVVRTPTGHEHTSTAPPPPGHLASSVSTIEVRLAAMLAA